MPSPRPIDVPADPCLLSPKDNNKTGQEIMSKASQIRSVETLACDAGWRNYHFLKIMTEDGIVGWSEYDEGFGAPGVTAAIERLAVRVVGKNAFQHERIYAELFSATRPAADPRGPDPSRSRPAPTRRPAGPRARPDADRGNR